MKKKGFTLVELLAIIVILAILALIATPMILRIIELAKKNSAQISGNEYINSVETSIVNNLIENTGLNYTEGKYDVATIDKDLKVTIKGDRPSEGNVCISNNGTLTKASLKINGYVVNYDGNEVINTDLEEIEEFSCNGDDIVLEGESILEIAKSLVYDENGKCKADGTTYSYMDGCYIKGASTNNYVWYNGFVWRIMGINSDDTVRLVANENVTVLPHRSPSTNFTYSTSVGYAHDWLNNYFYEELNNTKSIIEEGPYFCAESSMFVLSTGRTTCTSGSEVSTKVGLLTYDEFLLSVNSYQSYLYMGQNSWTMTPHRAGYAWKITCSSTGGSLIENMVGIRPVINVNGNSVVTSGDGNPTTLYILGEDKNSTITGTIGEKVTPGEYVNLEGKTYRVVSKDNKGIKLILDGFYEENSGISYKMTFGTDSTFNLDSGVGQKLNNDVINWLGLSNSNKILKNTYYQGDYSNNPTYNELLDLTNGVEANVGLIRSGEMLASHSSTMLTDNYTIQSLYTHTSNYWLITKYSDSKYAIYLENNNSAKNSYIAWEEKAALRPVITVKSNLKILGGNGVWNNPYEI